jgi:hypothetical protein
MASRLFFNRIKSAPFYNKYVRFFPDNEDILRHRVKLSVVPALLVSGCAYKKLQDIEVGMSSHFFIYLMDPLVSGAVGFTVCPMLFLVSPVFGTSILTYASFLRMLDS